MKHIVTLPGDWTHPYLLFRLLEVVGTPWTMTESGFTEVETGRGAGIAFGQSVSGLREAFENGGDLTRPVLSDAFLDAIAAHQSVVQLQVDCTPDEPLDGLLFVLRAANAVLDGGGLGVHFAASGLVHEADAFQALMRGVDEENPARGAYGLVVRYQLGAVSTTLGMDAFGLPDVVLSSAEGPDRAVGLLEGVAHRLLGGESFPTVDDARGGSAPNPFGITVL